MESYKIVIEQFSSEFEVSKGKTQERSFANCPGGGRGCKRGAPGVVGVSGIEGLSDKFVQKIGLRGLYGVLGGSGKTHRFKQSRACDKKRINSRENKREMYFSLSSSIFTVLIVKPGCMALTEIVLKDIEKGEEEVES